MAIIWYGTLYGLEEDKECQPGKTGEDAMQKINRNGSAVTAIIAACIFLLILAVFGKSVQGQGPGPTHREHNTHAIGFPGPFSTDAGYYHTYIPSGEEHNYWYVSQPIN